MTLLMLIDANTENSLFTSIMIDSQVKQLLDVLNT